VVQMWRAVRIRDIVGRGQWRVRGDHRAWVGMITGAGEISHGRWVGIFLRLWWIGLLACLCVVFSRYTRYSNFHA